VPLRPGANLLQVEIKAPDGTLVSTLVKTVVRDRRFSTASHELLYVDSVAPRLVGTIVIDLTRNTPLGLLASRHVRGISLSRQELYMNDHAVISTATHTVLRQLPLPAGKKIRPQGFLVSPDSRYVYSHARRVNLDSNTRLANLPINLASGWSSWANAPIPGGPTISADGTKIYVADRIIDTQNNRVIPMGIADSYFVSDVALTADERTLLVAKYGYAAGYLNLYETVPPFAPVPSCESIGGLGDFTGEMALSTDGQKVIIGSAGNPRYGGGAVTVVDLPSCRVTDRTALDLADNLTMAPDRDELFVSSGANRGIDVFVVQQDGTLLHTKSFFLGINRFVRSFGAPRHNDIRKIFFKPAQ
jgi:DNA-binding beta-propeller fold protein YncE